MSAARLTVGLVGAGLIGSALARRLLAAGFDVLAADTDPAKAEALRSAGARAAASAEALARETRVLVLAVFDTSQVEDVLEGRGRVAARWAETTGPRPAAIVTSTCDPLRIERLGSRLAARGVDLVECPLSGTSAQVAGGDALGLVAGEPKAVEALEAILAALAPRRVRLDRLGDGARAKLAVNLVLGLNRAALAEGIVLAERLGIAPERFLAVARQSAAHSQVMDVKGAKMATGDFAPHGRLSQSAKDFALIAEAAAGQALPLASAYRDLVAGCLASGEGDLDNVAVIRELRRRAQPPSAGPQREETP